MAPLAIELIGAFLSGGLHDHNAADTLALDIGLVDEQIRETAQKFAGTKLQDGLRKWLGQGK
jgi:hypothetical protein